MSESRTKVRWTKQDKMRLLHGLRTFGHKDVRNIAKLLPDKSIGAVRIMIYKYSCIANSINKQENPLKDWLQCGIFSETDTLIPEALLYISLFEEHPPPNETAGIDISKLYNFLYCASMNYSFPDLSTHDINALNALHEVTEETSSLVGSEVMEYLNSIYESDSCHRKYSSSKKHF